LPWDFKYNGKGISILKISVWNQHLETLYLLDANWGPYTWWLTQTLYLEDCLAPSKAPKTLYLLDANWGRSFWRSTATLYLLDCLPLSIYIFRSFGLFISINTSTISIANLWMPTMKK
jgi:hypothetical protein